MYADQANWRHHVKVEVWVALCSVVLVAAIANKYFIQTLPTLIDSLEVNIRL